MLRQILAQKYGIGKDKFSLRLYLQAMNDLAQSPSLPVVLFVLFSTFYRLTAVAVPSPTLF